jgi:prepilin-type N-terminal cleavage/methylation domain-containing protein
MLAKLRKMDRRKQDKGFTIIEVMIVLAIAGLILLIVFLAVPALQRSSRNTQRKSDVGRVGSAATTVLSNNNNAIASLTQAALQNEVGNLSYYTASQILVVNPATSSAAVNASEWWSGCHDNRCSEYIHCDSIQYRNRRSG